MTRKDEMERTTSVFDRGAMTPSGIMWDLGDRRRRPANRYLARAVSVLLWMFTGLAAVAVYRNATADDSALRSRAELLARQHAGCRDQCRVARMEARRSVLEFRADYDIDGVGAVQVVCRRAALVAGEYDCSVR
jgi:hypothetical protein